MKVNLDRLSEVLSAILSDRYGVRVTVTVEGGKNEKDNN
jgi:hypothetical protein